MRRFQIKDPFGPLRQTPHAFWLPKGLPLLVILYWCNAVDKMLKSLLPLRCIFFKLSNTPLNLVHVALRSRHLALTESYVRLVCLPNNAWKWSKIRFQKLCPDCALATSPSCDMAIQALAKVASSSVHWVFFFFVESLDFFLPSTTWLCFLNPFVVVFIVEVYGLRLR